MICRVLCPDCYRMFAFNTERVPAQRSYNRGSRRPGKPVAFYPTCTYCREKVEVSATIASAVATGPALAHAV